MEVRYRVVIGLNKNLTALESFAGIFRAKLIENYHFSSKSAYFFPDFFKNWPISTEILLKMHPFLRKWCSENRPSGWRIPVYPQRVSPPPPGIKMWENEKPVMICWYYSGLRPTICRCIGVVYRVHICRYIARGALTIWRWYHVRPKWVIFGEISPKQGSMFDKKSLNKGQ